MQVRFLLFPLNIYGHSLSGFLVCVKGGRKLSKLTLKQQRFADEYIICGNATEAAIKAGYAKRSAQQVGSENLLKPVIKSYIDKRLEELKSEKVADQQEVLEFLTSVMRGEKTEQTLCSIGELGQQVIDIDIGAKDRIKAAELIGKRHRLWTEKVEQTVDFDGKLNIVIDYGDDDGLEDSIE
jgi:phage terminase small subunit